MSVCSHACVCNLSWITLSCYLISIQSKQSAIPRSHRDRLWSPQSLNRFSPKDRRGLAGGAAPCNTGRGRPLGSACPGCENSGGLRGSTHTWLPALLLAENPPAGKRRAGCRTLEMLRLEPAIPARCPHAPARQPPSTEAGPSFRVLLGNFPFSPLPTPTPCSTAGETSPASAAPRPQPSWPSVWVPLSEGLAPGSCLLAITWAVCPPSWGFVFPRVARAEPEIGRAPPSLAFRETFQKCLVEWPRAEKRKKRGDAGRRGGGGEGAGKTAESRFLSRYPQVQDCSLAPPVPFRSWKEGTDYGILLCTV